MSSFVILNGDLLPLEKARISPVDHGFLYGDGIYETLRTHEGKIFDFEAHFSRLQNSAELLHIPLQWKSEELLKMCEELISATDLPFDKGGLRRVSWNSEKYISYNPELKEKAQENRKNPTAPEQKIWSILSRKNFLGYKFTRQKQIGNYITDFYCGSLGIVIEIDGYSHGEQEEYDKKRSIFLESLGIKVVRYTNPEVMKNIEGVYEDLEKKIGELENKPPLTPPCQGENKTPSNSPLLGGEQKEHRIRITLTRGENSYQFIGAKSPTLLITISPLKDYTKERKGISLTSLKIERILPEAKTVSMLVNNLAKQKCAQKNAFECALIDHEGFVTEGAVSNIVCVKNGTLFFTPEGHTLAGTAQLRVLETAKKNGIPVQEKRYTLEDLQNADEVMITNSLFDVLPVKNVRKKTIKNCPGEMYYSLFSSL